MMDFCTHEPKDLQLEPPKLNELIEIFEKLCPAIAYTLIPYFITLMDGGCFTWEKEADEVTVSCPMALAQFKLKREDEGFTVSCEGATQRCRRHTLGQKMRVDPKREDLLLYDILYPLSYLVHAEDHIICLRHEGGYLQLGDRGDKVSICELEKRCEKAKVNVSDWQRWCEFHRRKKKVGKLVPDGFCHSLYHKIYPHALSMLYGKKDSEEMLITCDGDVGTVKVMLERSKKSLPRQRRYLDKKLREFGVPQDILFYDVTCKVLGTTGHCIKGLVNGMRFRFRDRKIMCPASFDNIYPCILSGKSSASCPSAICRIRYEVRDD